MKMREGKPGLPIKLPLLIILATEFHYLLNQVMKLDLVKTDRQADKKTDRQAVKLCTLQLFYHLIRIRNVKLFCPSSWS